MAEPQPASVQEGIDPEGPPAPTGGDARKAAAALSTLDQRGDDSTAPTKNIDQEALSNAISRLELTSGKVTPGGEQQKEREAEARKEKERRAKIKVDAADVGLLVRRIPGHKVLEGGRMDKIRADVEELDLNKIKATELLKAHEGDAMKALRAFVTANV
ncbi:MAG: hypothetical protein Q9195_003090 [Heterodermia aff. obscurata]